MILKQTEVCGVNSLLNFTFSVRRTVTGGSRIGLVQYSTGWPVNFVTPVKFVTCRKNAQGQAIFTFSGGGPVHAQVPIHAHP